MDKEKELQEAIQEFYATYRKLQKTMKLRMNSHFGLYTDNWIEIWQYSGEEKKLLIKVKTKKEDEDADIECYKRASDHVKSMMRK